MWMPLLGPLPKPAWFAERGEARLRRSSVRLLRRRARQRPHVVGHGLLPVYAAGEAAHGISPLTDQSIAGVIMMVEGTLVTLGVLVWLFLRAAREASERQRLLDLADARGVALDERARGARRRGGRGRPARGAASSTAG